MSGAATLIGLVLYPIIFGLPTVALLYTLPDPAFDFPQQTIEVADDRQTQISHFALAFVVVALSIASHRSTSVIGFTKVNWQIAVSLGALVSSLPLGLGGLLNRLQTSEQRLAEPLNHGSLFYRSATLVQPCSTCRERLMYEDESNYSYVWFSCIVIGIPALVSLLASQYHAWVWIQLLGLALNGAGVGIYMSLRAPVRPPSLVVGNRYRQPGPAEESEHSTHDPPSPK